MHHLYSSFPYLTLTRHQWEGKVDGSASHHHRVTKYWISQVNLASHFTLDEWFTRVAPLWPVDPTP